MLRSIHGFKNRNGHRTVFLKNFGSTPFFDRCWLVLRLLTGPDCSWFSIEPVRPTSLVRFLKQWKYPRYIFVLFCFVLIFVFIFFLFWFLRRGTVSFQTSIFVFFLIFLPSAWQWSLLQGQGTCLIYMVLSLTFRCQASHI